MDVSFIIPVLNNADTIGVLSQKLSDLSSAMKWNYEIVFVDDCSKDNSLEILSQFTFDCTVIHLTKNQGQSTAVLVGMKYAKGDVLVSMDADLQDSPDFIPQLINGLNNETDVVFSGRMGNYEKKSKLVSAKGFKYVLHLLSKRRLPQNACMFFAVKRSAATKLIPYTGSRPYLLSVIAKTKLHCISVPYVREPSISGKSNYTFIKRWKVALRGIFNFITLHPKEIESHKIIITKTPPF